MKSSGVDLLPRKVTRLSTGPAPGDSIVAALDSSEMYVSCHEFSTSHLLFMPVSDSTITEQSLCTRCSARFQGIIRKKEVILMGKAHNYSEVW